MVNHVVCPVNINRGWLIDSSYHNLLWFDIKLFDWRGAGLDGLLHQAMEQFAAVRGKTPVKPEGKLIQIPLQVPRGHRSLIGAAEPAF